MAPDKKFSTPQMMLVVGSSLAVGISIGMHNGDLMNALAYGTGIAVGVAVITWFWVMIVLSRKSRAAYGLWVWVYVSLVAVACLRSMTPLGADSWLWGFVVGVPVALYIHYAGILRPRAIYAQ